MDMIEIHKKETNQYFKEISYASITNHWKEMNQILYDLNVYIESIKKILTFLNRNGGVNWGMRD